MVDSADSRVTARSARCTVPVGGPQTSRSSTARPASPTARRASSIVAGASGVGDTAASPPGCSPKAARAAWVRCTGLPHARPSCRSPSRARSTAATSSGRPIAAASCLSSTGSPPPSQAATACATSKCQASRRSRARRVDARAERRSINSDRSSGRGCVRSGRARNRTANCWASKALIASASERDEALTGRLPPTGRPDDGGRARRRTMWRESSPGRPSGPAPA